MSIAWSDTGAFSDSRAAGVTPATVTHDLITVPSGLPDDAILVSVVALDANYNDPSPEVFFASGGTDYGQDSGFTTVQNPTPPPNVWRGGVIGGFFRGNLPGVLSPGGTIRVQYTIGGAAATAIDIAAVACVVPRSWTWTWTPGNDLDFSDWLVGSSYPPTLSSTYSGSVATSHSVGGGFDYVPDAILAAIGESTASGGATPPSYANGNSWTNVGSRTNGKAQASLGFADLDYTSPPSPEPYSVTSVPSGYGSLVVLQLFELQMAVTNARAFAAMIG